MYGITANGVPAGEYLIEALDYVNPADSVVAWRWTGARYFLIQGSSLQFFVAGSRNSTDYPDFHSIAGNFDIPFLGKNINLACNLNVKVGPGVQGGMLVDRFGNIYAFLGGGIGVGFSFLSYMEGYVVSSAYDFVWHGNRTLISDPYQLSQTILGIAEVEVSAYAGVGAGAQVEAWWAGSGGSGALLYTVGIQGGASLDVSTTWLVGHDSTLGWNWAIQDQLGQTPWIRAIYLEDVIAMSLE
jgi:hypothetical protein